MAERQDSVDLAKLIGGDSPIDRILAWTAANPAPVLGALAAILLIGAGYAIWDYTTGRAEDAAATALARARTDYVTSMGGTPGAAEVAEPANPETASQARTAYAARLAEIVQEHPGTDSAVLARVARGDVLRDAGNADGALEEWKASLAAAASDALRGVILERVAAVHEGNARSAEAAAAHLEAADLTGYPLRYFALADAARCLADAGRNEEASAAYDRLRSEAPDFRVPPHIEARLQELKLAVPAPPTAPSGG
jgi:predicted negative regulator of RcsB-dependent stress response